MKKILRDLLERMGFLPDARKMVEAEEAVRRWENYARALLGAKQEAFGTFQGITDPTWDREDADKLRQFLISSVGRRLKAKLNYREQLVNREAVHLLTGNENAAGYARGYYDALRFITVELPIVIPNLPAHVPPQEDNATQEQPGDAALRERLSP